MGRARALVTALLVVASAAAQGCSDGDGSTGSRPSTSAPSDAQVVEIVGNDLPVRAQVAEWGRAKFTADGAIVATYRADPEAPHQVAWISADGGEFACITCATMGDMDVGAPLPFPDGERLWVQHPSNMNAAAAFSYWIVSCTPSLADCERSTRTPVRGFVESLADPAGLQDREVRLAPDGRTLVWTRIRPDGYFMLLGRLEQDTDGYRVGDVRVVNPPGSDLDGDVAATALAAAWYEAKDVSRDGRYLTFSSSMHASLNYDSFVMDLTDGTVRRLTLGPDWDEDASLSPDGTSIVVGSAEGSARQAAFGNLARPSVIDAAVVGPLSNYYLPRTGAGAGISDRRVGYNRPLLIGFEGQRSERSGLDLAEGEPGDWEPGGGGLDWSPDGAALLQPQRRRDATGAFAEYRLRLRRLVGVRATRLAPAADVVEPTWAPPLSQRPPRQDLIRDEVVDGPYGGTATIRRTGNILRGTWSVTYSGYSQDGCSRLDGEQSTETTNPITAHYREDLTLTGCHTGWSRADVWFRGPDSSGSVASVMDGRAEKRSFG